MTEKELRDLGKLYDEYKTIRAYKEDLERGDRTITINANCFSMRDGLIQLCDRQMNAIKDILCNYTGTETSIEDFEDE